MAIASSSGAKFTRPRPQGTLVKAHHSAETSGEWYR